MVLITNRTNPSKHYIKSFFFPLHPTLSQQPKHFAGFVTIMKRFLVTGHLTTLQT